MILLKCSTQYASTFGKWSSGHRAWKGQFSSQRRSMPKNVQTTTQLHSFHMIARSVQSVHSLSCVWLFVTPWTATSQASLSNINSLSKLRLTSIESVIPSSHPAISVVHKLFSKELVCEIRELCDTLNILLHCHTLDFTCKTDLFQSFSHCWVFQVFWNTECSTLTVSSFRIWNSSAGVPSPPIIFVGSDAFYEPLDFTLQDV